MKMVIAGDKYDSPELCRLKLHEEYGRVWLYRAMPDGRSMQNGRILCIDDDGRLRIHATHTTKRDGTIYIDLESLHDV
jgi:hypothetical protein